MSVRKLPSGRWQARVKDGRRDVASKSFDTRRSALAWEAEQRAKLAGGAWVDPKSGRIPVRQVVEEYLATRPSVVTSKTLLTEQYLLGRMSPALGRLPVSAVTTEDIQADLARQVEGWSTASLRRYRGVLSALFTYAASRRLRGENPVRGTRTPTGAPDHAAGEMLPFTLDELREVVSDLMEHSPEGKLALVMGSARKSSWRLRSPTAP